MPRQPQLETCVKTLGQAFDMAKVSPPGRLALRRVFDRLAGPAGKAAATVPAEALPVTALYDQALAPLLTRADALTPLANALATLTPDLRWTTRKSVGPTASPGFAQAHANAVLIGPGGVEHHDAVWIGLSLLAPHTRYPDHDHAPEEVYLMLSQGAFRQGDADWQPHTAGDTVYNSPGIRHAMRAGDLPFLALWCLPL